MGHPSPKSKSNIFSITLLSFSSQFCESIPSSVLQTYALIGADEVSKQAVFSIVCSAMAIAFASSSISTDFDIDPNRRIETPEFYGYTPDQNRLLVFVLMMLMTSCHVLMKVIACSLLMGLDKLWFLLYILSDTCLYFGYKIARGDFRYVLRLEGALSWIVSFIMRSCQKTIVDFTLLIVSRCFEYCLFCLR